MINILGKSNNTISLLGDAISSGTNTRCKINIYKNMPDYDGPEYLLEKIPNIDMIEYFLNEVDTPKSNLILGVIRVPTKIELLVDLNKYDADLVSPENHINIIHPTVIASRQSEYGNGIFLGPGCIITPYVKIGNFTTLNRRVSIGHHTSIGNCVTLNPGVNIAGGTNVGDFTTVGMGANIVDGVNIGANSIIGAGSLVTKSIPDNAVAFGVPAKIIRKNKVPTEWTELMQNISGEK